MKLKKYVTLAMLLALYVVLAVVKPVKLSNFEFTFEGMVTIITAFMFTPLEAIVVAGFGSLMYQAFFSGYPFTITALIWVIPHLISALIVSLLAKTKLRKLDTISGLVIGLAMTLSSTAFNTLAMYLDCLIYQYSSSYILVSLATRIIASVILGVVYGMLLPKLIKNLQKRK